MTLASRVFDTDAEFSSQVAFHGRVSRSGNRVVFHDSLDRLAAYDANLEEREWLANLTETVDIAESDEFTYVSFGNGTDECATGSDYCIRRYDSRGQTTWTVGLPTAFPAVLAPRPDGGAVAAVGLSDLGFEVFIISDTGDLESIGSFEGDIAPYLSAAHADGAGGIVVTGSAGNYASGRAFVTRIDGTGAVVWDQRQFFPGGTESAGLDVYVSEASVFVYGLANNETSGLGFTGDAWAARVSL